MTAKSTQPQVLIDVWEIFLRFRWRFIVPAFVVLVGVLAASLFIPRKYKAEAIFERRTDLVLAEIMNRGAATSFQDPRQSLVEEVTGQPAVDQLMEFLKTHPDSSDAARAVTLDRWDRETFYNEIGHKVTVSYDISTTDLDRIRVSYVTDDGAAARLIVNGLVQNHIDRTRARLEERLRASAAFFRTEADKNRATIESVEAKKLAFEIDHSDLLPDNPNSIQSAMASAQARLISLRQECESTTLRIASLKKSLETTPEKTPNVVTSKNPELAQLEAKLRADLTQLAQYVGPGKMTDKHPDIVALRQEITDLRTKIGATDDQVVTETQTVSNPKRAELDLMITSAQADIQSFDKQISQTQERIAYLDSQSSKMFPVRNDYMKLSREVDEAQRQLAFWEDNLRRVEMARTAESGQRGIQFSFIKPCELLLRPVSPNLGQVIAAAVALGLLTGGISVFFAHRTYDRFREAQELGDSCALPVFGAVSEIISRHDRRARRLRHMLFYPLQGAAMALVVTGMVTLLYLDLEKPAMYAQLKENPARFIRDRLAHADEPAPLVEAVPATQPAQAEAEPAPVTTPQPQPAIAPSPVVQEPLPDSAHANTPIAAVPTQE